LVKPLREGRPEVARDYRDLLTTYPELALIPVDAEIAERAADLRACYGLRTPDALQVATALHAGATAFLTNDARLTAVKELEVVLLDELGEP
ncbi:MAG: PIN domain-containing protein, partial [Candidatus Hadarchaeum sp.]